MPKVSVVMPVFNAEGFLNQCLDSLLCQTLEDIQIICVNDGSTDRSAEILDEYAAKDQRVIVLTQENTGAGAARNYGFSHVKGEYVVFLDCDDFFAETFLQKTYQAGIEKQADVVLFCARTYDNRTGKYGPEHAYLRKEFLPGKDVFSGDDIPSKIFVATSPAPWLRLLRSDFVRENRLSYQNLSNSNDFFFTQMSMAVAKRICTVLEDFVFYRINNASSLQGSRRKFNLCFAQAVEALYDELNARGLYEKYRISFLHSALGCFNDKIRRTNDVAARDEIFRYMTSEAYQRMDMLGHPMEYYGGSWLYNQANDQYEMLVWYQNHKKQAAVKKTECIVARKSKDRPIVSVIIPMYNTEKYLQETLQSIANQTLRNIEIICVNDGSTDGTLDALVKYAQNEPRMAVYSHENSGLSATRNVGYEKAEGKFIYFLDGDDMLKEQALETLVIKMRKDNLDILLFDADVLEEDGCDGSAFVYKRKGQYNVCSGPELLCSLSENKEYYSCAVMYMMRASWIKEKRLSFHRAILHEDQGFTFQALMNARRASHIPEQFYIRRVRDDSIMTRRVSFGNVHGLFHSYLDMNTTLATNAIHLSSAQYMVLSERVTTVLDVARKKYAQLTSAQQYCRFTLGEYEPVFRDLFVKGFDAEVRYRNEIKKADTTNAKLQKQVAELTEKVKQLNQSQKNPVQQASSTRVTTDAAKYAASPAVLNSVNASPRKPLLAAKNVKMQLITAGKGIKQKIKRIIPTSYSRSAFEAQVLADLISGQTTEILKNQHTADSNNEVRFAALEEGLKVDSSHRQAMDCLAMLSSQQEKLFAQQERSLTGYAKKAEEQGGKILSELAEQYSKHSTKQDAIVAKHAEQHRVQELLIREQNEKLEANIAQQSAKLDTMKAEQATLLEAKTAELLAKLDTTAAEQDKQRSAKLDTMMAEQEASFSDQTRQHRSQEEHITGQINEIKEILTYHSAKQDTLLAEKEKNIAKREEKNIAWLSDQFDNMTEKYHMTQMQHAARLDTLASQQEMLATRHSAQIEALSLRTDSLIHQFEKQMEALTAHLEACVAHSEAMSARLQLECNKLGEEIASMKDHNDQSVGTLQADIQRVEGGMKQIEALQNEHHQQIVTTAENIIAKSDDNCGYAREAVWASVFNNTVTGSEWLHNLAFSAGRWAVGYQFLYVMYRTLNEIHPKSILELGLGQSTRMLAQYAEHFKDVVHDVVEADPSWIEFFKNNYPVPRATNIVQLDYGITEYKGEEVRVYNGFREAFADKRYEFIAIDAPLGGDLKKYSRIDVLLMLPQILSDRFVIMVDDTNRQTESNMVGAMVKVLKDNNIEYKFGRYAGQKETILICSPDVGFLRTL